jgi:hypothetical protein
MSDGGRLGANPSEAGHRALLQTRPLHADGTLDTRSAPGASSAAESSSEAPSSAMSMSIGAGSLTCEAVNGDSNAEDAASQDTSVEDAAGEDTATDETAAEETAQRVDASERKPLNCNSRASSNTETRNTGPFMQSELTNARR